jgi:hypothetical protein
MKKGRRFAFRPFFAPPNFRELRDRELRRIPLLGRTVDSARGQFYAYSVTTAPAHYEARIALTFGGQLRELL